MSKKWQDLGSDVDWRNHGGCWGRPDPSGVYDWIVVQFDRSEEESGHEYYCVEYGVDLDDSYLQAAQESCFDVDHEVIDADKAYALVSYGASGVLTQASGNNARKLLKACGMGGRLR